MSGTALSAAFLARKAAAFTRFWHAVEQKRRVPFRETSTYTRSHAGALHSPSRSMAEEPPASPTR